MGLADSRLKVAHLFLLGCLVFPASGLAQQTEVPDAQVESNVLKALAAVPDLAEQAIGTTTVYGTVTITGSVPDEATRGKAEQAVANAPGVKKVVDELVIGTPTQTSPNSSQAEDQQGPDPADQNMQADAAAAPQDDVPPPTASPSAGNSQPQQSSPYPPYAAPGGGNYPPAYSQQRPTLQQPGESRTLPVGTYLRVRINQAMDSRHTPEGTPFDGVVTNQVILGGMIAVPRGAQVQGQVVNVQPGGNFRGRGGLALQLTQITLEGRTYPISTEPWTHQGYDKTGQTVGTTAGLGAVGALIGAVAGGGPGALLGAGIGGVAGLGLSSVSHQGDATVPSEALIDFRLSQQTAINTVSQAELDRLAATMPPPPGPQQPQQLRRRYPPPSIYGPVAYPYAYPAPYYPPYYYR